MASTVQGRGVPAARGVPTFYASREEKATVVQWHLEAKEKSGKTFTQIAAECGWTNCYTAQLFHAQAQLRPEGVSRLREAVPDLEDEQVELMQRVPQRSFDPTITQEPHVYRLHEAVMHYGESLKALLNEEFGDGIMSAINFYMTVDKVIGVEGDERVVITFNGKFLPHIEQKAADNTAFSLTPEDKGA